MSNSVWDWSPTAANNNAAAPYGWTSGSMKPTDVEPTARQMMATIAEAVHSQVAGGTADALTVTLTNAPTAYTDGMVIKFRASAANATTTPTLNVNSLGAKTITRDGGIALKVGDISANLAEYTAIYNLANTRWELQNPHIPNLKFKRTVFTASGTYTPVAGLLFARIEVTGAGGGAGGCASTGASQAAASGGGGAGEYASGDFTAAQIGTSQPITVGTGGAAGSAGANAGGAGGTTSVGTLISALGGVGSAGGSATSGNAFAGPTPGGTGGTGGDIRIRGTAGAAGFIIGGSGFSIGGQGGAPAGGVSTQAQQGTQVAGAANGSGAAGMSVGQNSVAVPGAAGADGQVTITEYYAA